MKLLYKLSFLLIAVLFFSSCEEDLQDLNRDEKNPTEVPGEPLFTSAQKELSDYLVNTNVNENVYRLVMQYWTETTYTDETNYNWISRNIPEQEWDFLYRDVIKDLDESIRIMNTYETATEADAVRLENKINIAEIHRIFAYSILVESFGNVPYSQAIDIETIYPKYDDQETIYMDLLSRLETAVNNLDPTYGSFGNSDNIYFGATQNWVKFGNSLMLRMAMMLADYNPSASVNWANTALEGGVFESNADNASFNYLGQTPNTNPLYIDLVASGRTDFVVANTFVDVLNDLDDPRRAVYFDDNLTDSEGNVIYDGGIYGSSNQYALFTHVTPTIKEPDFPGTLLTYAEVQFMKAEAAARGGGYNVSDPAAQYMEAVIANFERWGLSESAAMDYVNNTAPFDAANWDQSIGMQAWIALYNRGYAAWNFWRRIGYPQLEAPPEAAVSEVPVRMFYPIVEQTLNSQNYNQAADAIGGDKLTTYLFFDMD